MARVSIDSSAYQLQCAILAVPYIGLVATMTEQSKGRMLLPSRRHRNCFLGLLYDLDTTALVGCVCCP